MIQMSSPNVFIGDQVDSRLRGNDVYEAGVNFYYRSSMKKNSKSKSASVPRVDPYVDGLMSKLLDRLVSLEKKMDMIVAQTAGGRPAPEIKEPPRRDRILYEAVCAD